jgi:hypothetical protein
VLSLDLSLNSRRFDMKLPFTALHYRRRKHAAMKMKRRSNVGSLAKTKPESPADQVQRFERRLREVKQAIAALPGEEYHVELMKVVRRAGWTTLAEGIFFDALIESMLAKTRDLQQMHTRLKAAFEAVQGE